MVKLIFLSGSIRKQSVNKKLAELACALASKHDGVEAEFIDLADYDMPIYNGDWEDANGLPEAAKRLKEKFAQSDGFFISNPEYNSSYTPLLKNTIDWISRKETEDEPILKAFSGKIAALAAASPGAREEARVLEPVRMLLGNIRVRLMDEDLTLPDAYNAFHDDGTLKSDEKTEELENLIESFVKAAQ